MTPKIEVEGLEVDIDCVAMVGKEVNCVLTLGNMNSSNRYMGMWPGTKYTRNRLIEARYATVLEKNDNINLMEGKT